MSEPAGWVDDAPLFAAWRRFACADVAPFTIPGHKRRAVVLHPDLGRLLDADVPLYGGADTVKLTAGVLAEAERRAARLWGADVCRFSTGGSTHANQVLCLALAGRGTSVAASEPAEPAVLVARNAHRSVVSGLALAGLRPVWLPVGVDPRTGAPTGLSAQTVRQALAEHPDVVGLFCTEPSYQGTLTDLRAVVAAAHEHDVPVLVDQAWGAHLGLAPGYPEHALQAGADAMVTSAHKMLPAFSQAALVLARTERLDADRLARAFEATHTTSPSAAILASTDAARAFLAADTGRAALERTAVLVAAARTRLREAGLLVLGPEDFAPGRFDPAKLVVHFAAAGRSGLAAEAQLLARGVPVEMADRDALVAQVGLVDDAGTLGRLVEGVLASLAGPPGPPRPVVLPAAVLPPQRLTPRQAFGAAHVPVPRADAVGRVSAELVAPYPPGVPLLVPGEEVTAPTLRALDAALAAGNRIAYAADPGLRTLQVVAG
ncbi:MAG: aminotransferase class I/II-fold pyridoxal phosphate-dependent enzyme [Motilibacteraceae bacterium]